MTFRWPPHADLAAAELRSQERSVRSVDGGRWLPAALPAYALCFLLGGGTAALYSRNGSRPPRAQVVPADALDRKETQSKFNFQWLDALNFLHPSQGDKEEDSDSSNQTKHVAATPAPLAVDGRLSVKAGKYAYVMMAYDPPGKPVGESMWGALAMARALQRMSKYLMVLLTNTTTFPDGTDVKAGFAGLNVDVRPVYELDITGGSLKCDRWRIAYWKLQIWMMTEFEKLIWLDADATLTRSIDWLFEKDEMYAQRDDWLCDQPTQTNLCSGIMLLFPSQKDFAGIIQFSDKVGTQLKKGDQELLTRFFSEVKKKPIQVLSNLEASFGQCTGTAPTFYVEANGSRVNGSWSLPAFVHKSGFLHWDHYDHYADICFSWEQDKQRCVIDNTVVNACHFNPLATHWRMLFCEAVGIVRLNIPKIDEFCSDTIYYRVSVPINIFYSNADKDHTYHLGGPREGEVMTLDPVPFRVFRTQEEGTVPIKEYWSHRYAEHTYHQPPAWQDEEEVGTAFYAFETQADDTKPVYAFWVMSTEEHRFHIGGPDNHTEVQKENISDS
eukprot:CAMPEP_0195075544 /NCGR_PEP_ID=MMETSP0448-20130528/18395_1 /TAXON_ID=66468 /ORGANISM="Heterocapsa triquestra, Strain CCMP 448" /LENGTH=554 /DNA_ID=CAMNT_0040107939 /DNA_START=55 /DNA_END=1719 /DNA_ORIENTATION=+